MLKHTHWFKPRTKFLHSYLTSVDGHGSVCLRLTNIYSNSLNSVILWKSNNHLSFREPLCVQNQKLPLCSFTTASSNESDVSSQVESQFSQDHCLESSKAGPLSDKSQQQNLAFFKQYNTHIHDKHAKRHSLLGWRGRMDNFDPVRKNLTKRRRSYYTGVQYHKTGSEAAKWKQGTQPGL